MTRLPELDAAARQARVAEIRRQIAAGTYETPEKLEQAIEAFLDRLPPPGIAPIGPPRRPK
jgi:anti-sigma-28 factor FlgM